MKDISITVPAEYIGVLKLFAAKTDKRYYLNGILLEIGPTESRLVATDGHRLGVFRVGDGCETLDTPVSAIIPLDYLAHVKPIKGLGHAGDVVITISQCEVGVRFVKVAQPGSGLVTEGRAIDGEYPDWRRAIPKGEVSGVPAQFNATYIGDLGKAASILNPRAIKGTCVGIGHNGDGGALIDLFNENFIGVIMPMRGDQKAKSAPAWAFGDLCEDSPQAEAA